MNAVDFLRNKGYPYKIKVMGKYEYALADIQPLIDGEYTGVYRGPRGCLCIDKNAIIGSKGGVGGYEVLE